MDSPKKMKIRNPLIVGIISIATVSAFASLLLMSSEISLEQIIKDKDCQALQKWEEEHVYEDALELSPELRTEIFKMEMECETKAFTNIFGDK